MTRTASAVRTALVMAAGSLGYRAHGGRVTANPEPGAHTIAYATGDGKFGVVDLDSGGAAERKGPWKKGVWAVAWHAG
ncbi:hypothetical protein ACWC0A_07365 [Streptomyces scopuliridis]